MNLPYEPADRFKVPARDVPAKTFLSQLCDAHFL
jgi:hypothetical protein